MAKVPEKQFQDARRSAYTAQQKLTELLSPITSPLETDTTFATPIAMVEERTDGAATRMLDHISTITNELRLAANEELLERTQKNHIAKTVAALEDAINDYKKMRDATKKILKQAKRTEYDYEAQDYDEAHTKNENYKINRPPFAFEDKAREFAREFMAGGTLRNALEQSVVHVSALSSQLEIDAKRLKSIARKINERDLGRS